MSHRRRARNRLMRGVAWGGGLFFLVFWGGMLLYVLARGLAGIDLSFFLYGPSALFGKKSILPYVLNTVYVLVLTLLISWPIGVGASIFFNVYLPKGKLRETVQFWIDAVLSLPTVVTGLIGLTLFSRFFGLKNSLLAGVFTLCITMIPLVMYTTRKALHVVPEIRVRQALAMGATKWHLIWRIMLPECLPGLVYGGLLAGSRILAESTALLLTAGAGGAIANSITEAYASSGATLAVYLYVAVQHQGDLQTAFSVAAVLLLLVMGFDALLMWSRRRWIGSNW